MEQSVTAFSACGTGVSVVAAVVLLAGCSADPTPDEAPAAAAVTSPLARCEPLTDEQIAQAVGAEELTSQLTPPTCVWNAKTADGETDLTFAFSEQDSLLQLWHRALQDGFETEHVVLSREALGTTITANGFSTRDPRDPGSCAVSAAANGTLTWHVQNRSHAPRPDPCAAALELASLTIDLAP
ncbi:MAG: DUF3558 domain-containing protein [Rhodococcus sp. (in: high G+C Gram-positive bacteria)]|nr:MAG: DUF3558 domain-containing protein [Rhodococcus sp. (in: high G+C Gram-positive bacteria)]